MTGFARQAFRFQQLPEEIASWMIGQSKKTKLGVITLLTHAVCLVRNEALDEKYFEILGVRCAV